MKKITIAILTAVYLIAAIGVSASSFYCCGILKSTTYSIGADHASDSKATAQSNHCCKTTKQFFKVKDNHYGSGSFLLTAKFFPVIIPFASIKLSDEPFIKVYTAFNSHAPPCGQQVPIYTLNCTYRI